LLCLTGVAFAGSIDVVRERVFAWNKAWQNHDIDLYMSFYSPAFRSKGRDYETWKQRKTAAFRKFKRIKVEIFDLSVFIEGKYATVRFVQHYKDPSYEDTGEKTLILVNTGDNWQIVSEEWKPLVMSKHPTKSKTPKPQVVHEQPAKAPKKARKTFKINPAIQQTVQEPRVSERKDPVPEKIVVKNITFQIEKKFEKVFVGLNQFSIPKTLTLGGDKPRIVIDFMNVPSWKGPLKIPVNGKIIRQIRTFLHKETQKLRIVLDLMTADDYIIDQTFYREKSIYVITVQ
jgi:ketosteroid isomerase-like protein